MTVSRFTQLRVRGCDECPMRTHEPKNACSVDDRELTGDLAQAPSWCPARGGVTIRLDELPGDYHRWTERGELAIKPQHSKGKISTCKRCGLRRKADKVWRTVNGARESLWVWTFEVGEAWTSVRPGCNPLTIAP